MGTCTIIPIQYGNFTFEGVPLHSRAVVTPIQSDDGITIKYYKVNISVEFVFGVPSTDADINGVTSTDNFMDNAKAILLTRGLPLVYNYRGFGKQVTTGGGSALGNDITYGPHPKILDWQPLGGNHAVKVVWEVEFHTLACPVYIPNDSNLSETMFKIVGFTEDTQLSYEEDGCVTVTTSGTLEVAAGNTFGFRDKLKRFITLFFPNQLSTFSRKIDISLRKDQRTVDYRITDTEIKSDNAFFPFMVKQSADHTISSSLFGQNPTEGSGFTSWASDLSASFEVRPGVWKGWAWIAFCILLANRRNRAASDFRQLQNHILDENDSPDGDDPNAARKARKKTRPFQYPLYLSIREEIYGRKVDINSKWVTVCSLFDLFNSTGMFHPVYPRWQGFDYAVIPPDFWNENAESNAFQWETWRVNSNDLQDGNGYRNLSLPNFGLIFDPCTTQQTPLKTTRNANYYSIDTPTAPVPATPSSEGGYTGENPELTGLPLGNGSYDTQKTLVSSYYNKGITTENSWINYDNTFQIIEETNSSYVPALSSYSVSNLVALSENETNSRRDAEGFRVNGRTSTGSGSLWDDDLIQVRGKPIYKVQMSGYAIRVGYQIPAPVMVAVDLDGAQHPVYRIGKQGWKHKLLNRSDEVPLFMAMWSQTYAIPKDIAASNIKFSSSGKPAEFA